MWRKDIQDTISGCEYFETPFDLYLMGYAEPHYPLPCVALEVVDNGNWMYIRKKRYKKLVAVFYLE